MTDEHLEAATRFGRNTFLGRTVSVQQPDGASTTHYAYSGNQTTVTDPAGNWKQFTKDALGNLTTVLEPDPNNQPSGTLTTSYTYNWMGKVTQVSMPRGSTTQTRTFVYDTGGRMTSATNPENGTVTYAYNSDNTLHDKHDAKGQDAVYSYDSLKRVIEVQRYPNGVSYPEDTCARVTYTYDTNPVNSSFSQYSAGRLTTSEYNVSTPNTWGGCEAYTEMYSYHPAGAVTAKNLQLTTYFQNQYGYLQTGTGSLEADYTYDSAGRTSTVTYPMAITNNYGEQPVLTTTYDTMGRPASMTEAAFGTWSTAQYDYAGRMTNLSYLSGPTTCYTDVSESHTYNVNGQLATLGASYYPACASAVAGTVQYAYSATQNNGQITQAVDGFSGETIGYQYDALKRLTSAGSTPTSGSTPTAWTQTYQYDGFGNLTAKVLNGTTTPISVNATTNQLTNAYYDANGNMTSGVSATFTYDEANRNITAAPISGGEEYYGYDAANKRVYQAQLAGAELVTFYGAKGEKLGVYAVNTDSGTCATSYYPGTCTWSFISQTTSVWFAGKLIMDSNNGVVQDRLGTNRVSGARFRPFGDEITSTSNDREKFATYTRDSYTGLDYADQRFYANTYGRFNTPDPYKASAGPADPGSWNRYTYTRGDPINRRDPSGLDDCPADDPCPLDEWDVIDDYWDYSAANASYAMFCMFDPICYSSHMQGQGGGATIGSTAQNGIVQGSPDFAMASAALAGEQADLSTLFQSAQSPECEHDLAAVGVIDAQVSQAAGSANIINGLTSLTNYASDIYGNSPAAGAAAFQFGSMSMAQFMSLNSNVAAVSQAPGNNIYINAAWVNGMTTSQQTAMLLHELVHGITGSTDPVTQQELGLPTNVASQNIGDMLQRDCFK